MAEKIAKPGTEDGPCRRRCNHEKCHAMKLIAGTECYLCEEQIGWNAEYEMNSARYVHSECLALAPSVEAQLDAIKSMTTRQARGVPHIIDCWRCAQARPINDNCIVSRCGTCGDDQYEYDVPTPNEAEMRTEFARLDSEFVQKAKDFKRGKNATT